MFAPSINVDLDKLAETDEKTEKAPAKKVARPASRRPVASQDKADKDK
ncbi:MAG: hypothetical protein IT304_08510 [Dehalococcoidia bacterium]|nr:hypothetical protein [Dehalococcoidia bacterium]